MQQRSRCHLPGPSSLPGRFIVVAHVSMHSTTERDLGRTLMGRSSDDPRPGRAKGRCTWHPISVLELKEREFGCPHPYRVHARLWVECTGRSVKRQPLLLAALALFILHAPFHVVVFSQHHFLMAKECVEHEAVGGGVRVKTGHFLLRPESVETWLA